MFYEFTITTFVYIVYMREYFRINTLKICGQRAHVMVLF